MSKGVKYILLASFYFSLMNVCVKLLPSIPAYEIVFVRSIVTLIVCYISLKRIKISIWGNNKTLLIARGLAGTVALMMYFYTLQNMPLATAVTVQYLSPIFTIIFATLILKEKTRLQQWLLFILSLIGLALLKQFEAEVDTNILLIGVISAAGSGLAYNFVRKLKDYDHPLVVVFYFPLITVPLIGPYTISNWVAPDLGQWGLLILTGILTQIAQVYMTKAYQADTFARISNYNYLGPVLAFIYGFIIFDETVSVMGIMGILLILLSSLLTARVR
ncbi:MAG: DMT family transporter [Calditrichaeota bacterium]|nr:DMT family transporter [Calditrichota bacterium]